MKILYFAWIRERVGKPDETFSLPAGVRDVAALIAHLKTRGAGYEKAFADLTAVRVAVNEEHTGFERPLCDSDEIAFFPPVTGG